MALQTSGQISLNDLHVEAGGTSGTQASMNDSDIRGLISKASGAQSSFSQFYGASAVPTWSATMTVGNATSFKIQNYGYYVGSIIESAFGSITDSTVDNYSNSPSLQRLSWTPTNAVSLQIAGNNANSGWSTLTIGSTTFSRTSATYSQPQNFAQWYWYGITSNPFGTSGTKSVSLT